MKEREREREGKENMKRVANTPRRENLCSFAVSRAVCALVIDTIESRAEGRTRKKVVCGN